MSCFQSSIEDGKEVRTFDIPKMWGLGTPEDLKYYLEKLQIISYICMIESKLYPRDKKEPLVDIDETICFYEGKRIYEKNAIPSKENIDKINKLYDEGWEIVYWTARGSVSERDLYQLTKEQLESWGCKFDEPIVGYSNIYGNPNKTII